MTKQEQSNGEKVAESRRNARIVKEINPTGTPLKSIHLNDGSHGLPKNPRFIKDDRFKALCDSVRDNPEYMPARPIIVDENGVILGGNMRYRACKELKIDPLPAGWVQRVAGWPVDKKRRFILLDNQGFGSNDWDILANEYGDIEELIKAGFDPVGLDDLLAGKLDAPPKDDTVPDADPNIIIRVSIPAAVWIGKRDEVLGVCDRMEKTYLATIKVEE